MRHATEDTVDLGDLTLCVRRWGDPRLPTLVALHGGPSWDHSYLAPALAPLADRHHVILFDLRGCGRSSRDLPPHACQPEHCVTDLHRLVERLHLGAVDLLGFSYGGQLAMLFLARHPDQVRRLVLASTTAYPHVDAHLARWREFRRRSESTGIDEILGNPELDDRARTERMAATTAALDIWDLDLLPEWRQVLAGIRFSGDWMAPWRAGTLHSPRPSDPEDVLRRAARPTLLLHGAQDMRFPVVVARRLHAAVPHTELAIIEEAGHMAHFEQPEAWAGHLRRFLRTTLTGRRHQEPG